MWWFRTSRKSFDSDLLLEEGKKWKPHYDKHLNGADRMCEVSIHRGNDYVGMLDNSNQLDPILREVKDGKQQLKNNEAVVKDGE